MAAARELVIADEPAAWAALGFSHGEDGAVTLGDLRVLLAGRAAGSGLIAVRAEGLAAERPDALPLVAAGEGSAVLVGEVRGAATDAPHPNGATAIDHVVVLTDDRDRTAGALAAAGGDVRRSGEPPELPAPMAFVRFGPLIVEVAQAPDAGGQARFWGLTIVVAELEPLAGPLLGAARPAVQPGRRIATVTPAAGLSVALALITPR